MMPILFFQRFGEKEKNGSFFENILHSRKKHITISISKNMVWASRIIRLNVALGITSLAIQTQILVPWHEVISKDQHAVMERLERVELALKELHSPSTEKAA